MCLKMSFNVQTGGDVIQNVTKTYVPFNGIYRSWNFLEAGWIVFEIWSFQRYWEKLWITIRKIDKKQDIFPLETEDPKKSITRGSSIDIEKEWPY